MSDQVVLRLSGIAKTFPGVKALDGVELEVRAGEVHCLLGQNGAGKSTLIKVLSGAHKPDGGRIEWLGEEVHFGHPLVSMRAGIATIYQELDLVEGLSVADNVFLGHEPSQAGFVQVGQMRQAAREILARLGHSEIPVGREVGRLPSAAKQIVSMARALSYEAKLIIMDEPSAVLAHDEVANLFRVIRELAAQGIAVIYISHRLEEIREIGDRVTVLKDGRTSAVNLDAKATPTRALIEKMTGRDIEYVFPPRREVTPGEEVLRAELPEVSLTVRSGEIVGIAGLVGSGRSELLEAIYGARPHTGTVTVNGKDVKTVGQAVRAGLGLTPEERKSQALILHEPIFQNITLASIARFATAGFTRRDEERRAARQVASDLDLRPPDVDRAVGTLSGGNQQKVVLGRWLTRDTRLLLLDEPTRGVDVGARTELYQLIRRLADEGTAVLLVSSEVPEVLGLADRVLVMREGRVVHEAPAQELDEHTVLDLVMEGGEQR